ncbi:hypothetical protein LOCC1_G008543 [Lachnellula occidentalis]|uniref:BTB domain-containing protein n=1 Tax=Lachnellula occidentalis TaxID=215460 RepID=A0A8H8RJW2_9HELO|nr:hypothetical protein LOCC1_G008543 [Lachnellula occidentalis]
MASTLPQGTKRKAEQLNFRKSMGSAMVDLYVGPRKEHFHVHKDLLCNKIPYFAKMFKGGFQEAITNSASFPEDVPGSFDILITWVYHGKLRPLTMLKDNRNAMAWKVIALYSLAEKLCVSELMDDIMDAFRDFQQQNDTLPSCNFILTTYQKLDSNSPLRRYVCYCYTFVLLKETRDMNMMTSLLAKVPDLATDMAGLLRETGGLYLSLRAFRIAIFILTIRIHFVLGSCRFGLERTGLRGVYGFIS